MEHESNTTNSGVYRIKCLASGRSYIGSTGKSLSARIKRHMYDLNLGKHHNTALQNAWNKYGPSQFEFSIIERTELYLERETEFISLEDRPYNMCPVGGTVIGLKWSEEQRISRTGKLNPMHGVNRSGSANPMFGRTLSQARIQELREAWTGTAHPKAILDESSVRCIRKLYSTGEFTQHELGILFEVSRSTIRNVVLRVSWKHVK